MEEVTTIPTYEIPETTEFTEFTTTSYTEYQQVDDSMLEEILTNTKQSADCLTTVVAFLSVIIIYGVFKFVYNIFKSIFS